MLTDEPGTARVRVIDQVTALALGGGWKIWSGACPAHGRRAMHSAGRACMPKRQPAAIPGQAHNRVVAHL
jgi:hypothetical protein